jgi:ribosomal protein S18 acetylase RimI-like enzyme
LAAVSIRRLDPSDVPAVADLLEHLARVSITDEFSKPAEEHFLQANNAAAIGANVLNGFEYHVAVLGETVVGFVGVRDNSHLYHLFVAEWLQRQGIGRQLWQCAKRVCYAKGNHGRFTVNSSNNAISMYETFGFVRSASPLNDAGVMYNPMVLNEGNV